MLENNNIVAIARGIIDISFKGDVVNQVKKSSADMGKSLEQNIGGGTQKGVKQAESSLMSLKNTLSETAKGLGSALSLTFMTNAAQSVKQINTMFTVLTGSEEKAARQLEGIRQLADRTKQPFLEMAKAGQALLPALRNTNADLAQTVSIAQRLAILDPAQGVEGAAIAIRELLNGEVTSLAARFELSRSELRKLVQSSNGDAAQIIQGLDEMVGAMGLTEDAMAQIGEEGVNAFAVLKSELTETVALGFTPMLNNGIIPVVSGMGDMLRMARELNPELVTLTTTMAGFAAVGQAAQFAGVPGGAKLGMGAAVAYGGVQLGVAGSRALAETGVIDRPDLENISQEEGNQKLLDTLKAAVVAASDTIVSFIGIFLLGITTLANAWERAKLIIEGGANVVEIGFLVARNAAYNFADGIRELLNDMRQGLSEWLVALGANNALRRLGIGDELTDAGLNLLPQLNRGEENRRLEDRTQRDKDLIDAANALAEVTRTLQNTPLAPSEQQATAIVGTIDAMRQQIVGGLADAFFPAEEAGEELASAANAVNDAVSGQGVQLDGEILEAWEDFQNDLADIDAKAAQERLEAEQQHQEALTDLTADYQRQRQREAEDEARRAAKAQADLGKNILKVQLDTAAAIADVEDKYRKDEAKAVEEYREQEKRRQREYFNELKDAAARRDGVAVFDLLSRQREEQTLARAIFDKEKQARDEEKNERVAELRAQAQERIQEMRAEFQEAEAERAAERAIRLEREREDFLMQQERLNAQFAARMQQIDAQAVQEKALREAKFIEQNNKLAAQMSNHNANMIRLQNDGLRKLEEGYYWWLARMQAAQGQMVGALQPAATVANNVGNTFSGIGFATGGEVPFTGQFQLHKGEEVLTTQTARFLRQQVAGGAITDSGIQSLFNGLSGGGKQIHIGEVNVPIIESERYSPEQLRALVRNEFLNILEEY